MKNTRIDFGPRCINCIHFKQTASELLFGKCNSVFSTAMGKVHRFSSCSKFHGKSLDEMTQFNERIDFKAERERFTGGKRPQWPKR